MVELGYVLVSLVDFILQTHRDVGRFASRRGIETSSPRIILGRILWGDLEHTHVRGFESTK
jgi:hypothetical protein